MTEDDKLLWSDFFNKQDLKEGLRKMFCTDSCGIDWGNYEDYVLYGDTFRAISVPKKDE